jgi:methyl-accepting chemotaxis protein
MVALVQTRALAWAARANGGTSAVVMNAPIAEGRPFTGDEAFKLAAADSAMALAWNGVRVLVDHPSASASLKAALAAADQGYFSGNVASWRANVVSKLQAGQVSPVGIDEWRTKITDALGCGRLQAMRRCSCWRPLSRSGACISSSDGWFVRFPD